MEKMEAQCKAPFCSTFFCKWLVSDEKWARDKMGAEFGGEALREKSLFGADFNSSTLTDSVFLIIWRRQLNWKQNFEKKH